MKTRKWIYILFGILLCVSWVTPALTHAGSAARHRWEGAAIGLGVGGLLAGSAFFPPPGVIGPVPIPVPVPFPFPDPRWAPGGPPPPPPRDRDRHRDGRWDRDRHHRDWDHPRHHRRDGHWETRRVWVPPVFEDYYREGHYNRWGEWVPGHWERRMVQPGFWREERFWSHR